MIINMHSLRTCSLKVNSKLMSGDGDLAEELQTCMDTLSQIQAGRYSSKKAHPEMAAVQACSREQLPWLNCLSCPTG